MDGMGMDKIISLEKKHCIIFPAPRRRFRQRGHTSSSFAGNVVLLIHFHGNL